MSAAAKDVLKVGDKLDRYELLCIRAQGGMGAIWLARLEGKRGFEKLVAIKTILPEYTREPAFQAMFLDEAKLASRIEHPAVAQVIDLGEQDGVLYYVMEWVEGDSLRQLARAAAAQNRTIPLGIALRVTADVCGGLHAAHEVRGNDGLLLGVVHRDVSPQNILVSTAGAIKLVDFGIAKARDRIARETSVGTLKGKLEYMAPEQATGEADVDRRADVWAAAAVLYDLVAGHPPFGKPGQLDLLKALFTGQHPLPLPDSIPMPVRRVVDRALHLDRLARYPTALAMREAIESAIDELNARSGANDISAFYSQYMTESIRARRRVVEDSIRDSAKRRSAGSGSGRIGGAEETQVERPVSSPGAAGSLTRIAQDEGPTRTGTGTGARKAGAVSFRSLPSETTTFAAAQGSLVAPRRHPWMWGGFGAAALAVVAVTVLRTMTSAAHAQNGVPNEGANAARAAIPASDPRIDTEATSGNATQTTQTTQTTRAVVPAGGDTTPGVAAQAAAAAAVGAAATLANAPNAVAATTNAPLANTPPANAPNILAAAPTTSGRRANATAATTPATNSRRPSAAPPAVAPHPAAPARAGTKAEIDDGF